MRSTFWYGLTWVLARLKHSGQHGVIFVSVCALGFVPLLVVSARADDPPEQGQVVCPTCRTYGFGQNWTYSGYGPTVGVMITGGQGAIVANGAPPTNGAVISATSTTLSPALYASSTVGGLAFRFDGNGIMNGALSASNLAVSGATNIGGNLNVNGLATVGSLNVNGVLNLSGGLNLNNFAGPLNLNAQINGDAVIKGANTATDATATGIYGYASNGRGLIGASQNGNGVLAMSNGSLPALSASNQNGPAFGFVGNGTVTANTASNPALAVTNNSGAGLQVTGNTSVVANNGTVLNVQSNGSANKAIVANNSTGIAIEGDSTAGVAVYGYSTQYNGVVAQNNTANYPALYAKNGGGGVAAQFDGDTVVKGNLTVTGSKSGYVVDIAQNTGPDDLEAGDLVVITGYAPAVVGDIPVAKVKKASTAYATGVMGVADAHYINGSLQAGTVAPGEYFSVVTLGAFRLVKVDTSNGPIAPGDLLVASGANPGYAMHAKLVSTNGVPIAPAGVVGKALGVLDSGSGTIPVLVTLK